MVRDLRRFYRRLARSFGRQPLVAVIERGELNGRLHVHLAVSGFLSIEKMRRVWGHGHVWVGDDHRQNGRLPPRKLARYMAKYLGKQIDQEADDQADDRGSGGHRYFIAQGFAPVCIRRHLFDLATAEAWLERYYGQPDETFAWRDANLTGVHGVWHSYSDRTIAQWLARA